MRRILLATLLALMGLGTLTIQAREAQPPVIVKSASETCTLLRREGDGKPWLVVKEGEELRGGNLVLGLAGATLLSKNGAVQVALQSDLTGKSPFPIKESVIRLPAKASMSDLDIILDRGRIEIVNKKKEGEAKVRVTVHGEPWEVTLDKPGTRVVMEFFGRWARGVPFKLEPGPKDMPHANLILIVLSGEIQVKHDKVQFAMEAPPGPALIQWDNITGTDPSPQKLERLPQWVDTSKPSAEMEHVLAIWKKFRAELDKKPIGEILDEFVKSDDPLERRFAVFAMGALDDLPRLSDALGHARFPDVWENGVLALRHWIGRCPGQDQILYNRLTMVKKIPAVQAETILTLLHSFGEDDLSRKETYELLVRYLGHENLGIRGLAYWHLVRLYPAGKEFGYNPLSPKEERQTAQKKWRQLLADDMLPPKKSTGK